jgi:hypothetical protein
MPSGNRPARAFRIGERPLWVLEDEEAEPHPEAAEIAYAGEWDARLVAAKMVQSGFRVWIRRPTGERYEYTS